ncbi:MAG: hypothetical protein HUJ71_01945 [Pseudobutyrivibrio sp.]|nr:hypothetical protein [Pseudobutyrivibrio sp.]
MKDDNKDVRFKDIFVPVVLLCFVVLAIGTLLMEIIDNSLLYPDARVAQTITVDTTSSDIVITKDNIPLGVEEDNCIIHWLMAGLTVVFAGYNLLRLYQRSQAMSSNTRENNNIRIEHKLRF